MSVPTLFQNVDSFATQKCKQVNEARRNYGLSIFRQKVVVDLKHGTYREKVAIDQWAIYFCCVLCEIKRSIHHADTDRNPSYFILKSQNNLHFHNGGNCSGFPFVQKLRYCRNTDNFLLLSETKS